MRLRLSATRLGSRAELAAVADGPHDQPGRRAHRVDDAAGPGRRARPRPSRCPARWTSSPQLTGFGVYVLGVEVLAGRRSGLRPGRAGRAPCCRGCPSQPDFLPTGYTWLWPLVSRPTRLSDGTFADDVLAGEMAADGRLSRLLDAGSRIQDAAALTWVVDPELLSRRRRHGRRLPGAGARRVDRCRAAAPASPGSGWTGCAPSPPGQPVLALPVRRPGPGRAEPARPGRRDRSGRRVCARPPSPTCCPLASPVSDIAWPVDGFVNRGTLGGAARRRAHRGGPGRPRGAAGDRPQLHPGRPGRPGHPVGQGRRAARRPRRWPTSCAGTAPTRCWPASGSSPRPR